MTFGTVAILGPGLIGGSLARALAERKLATRLAIYARSERALNEIRAAKLPAELTNDPRQAVRGADVVILCVPIEKMGDLAKTVIADLKPGVLVTDVGSVKGSVVRELEPIFGDTVQWIGSHPMAGSEQTGFAAARADLFEQAAVILTPTKNTSPEAQKRAQLFWQTLGAHVHVLSPEEHDASVAQISHLPHIAAAALAARVSGHAIELAGGGFRDTTRIASGSPELWAEILCANAGAVVPHLDRLISDLEQIRQSLQERDPARKKSLLLEALTAAHHARAKLVAKRPS